MEAWRPRLHRRVEADVRDEREGREGGRQNVREEEELDEADDRERAREESRAPEADAPRRQGAVLRALHQAVEVHLAHLVERARAGGDESGPEESVEKERHGERGKRPFVPATKPTKAVITTKTVMRGFVRAT